MWSKMACSLSICNSLPGLSTISPYSFLLPKGLENDLRHACITVSKWPVSLPSVCNQEERLGDGQQWILSSHCLKRFSFSFCFFWPHLFFPEQLFLMPGKKGTRFFLPQRNQKESKRDFAPRESAPILWGLSIMFLH